MKIKEQLELLLDYYARTRGVGHTVTMIDGAKNADSVAVLTTSFSHARSLKPLIPNADFVSLDDIIRLQVMSKPLAIDNYALTTLLFKAKEEISRLEDSIKDREEFYRRRLEDIERKADVAT